MAGIPVLGLAAYSGTGKTTLLTRVVSVLKDRGVRVAVIKHDAHGLDFDREGKDSWLYTRAGADQVLLAGPAQSVMLEQREKPLKELISSISGADVILVEGFKHADIPQIGLCRKASGKGFTAPLSRYVAIATDLDDVQADVPVFDLNDAERIAEFIMTDIMAEKKEDFTHFNDQGRARMVNVGEKAVTCRTAIAGARVLVSRETFELIRSGGMKKGDVLTVAQIAGVMGAKRTPDLIPMCHPIIISGIDLTLSLDEERCAVDIRAAVSCDGKTGVEMEALTAASTAALTVYDMCKAVQKDMVVTDVRLIEKTGGIHGDFRRKEG